MFTESLVWGKKRKKPKFVVGQRVRIAESDKIYQTLDSDRKLDGILFMNQMAQYCGKELSIIKVVKTFEYKKLILNSKIPIYMLEGLMCDGNSELLEKKCDLSCYFMWHENWLEKL